MLTIGMAVYDDFDGAYFTIHHLIEQESHICKDAELIVVDNNPESRDGKRLKDFLGWLGRDFKKVKYVPYTKTIGTSAPRDLIFREASGEYVLCMDSHLILQREALPSLMKYYRDNPNTPHLLCGPMVYDNRQDIATHFEDIWRHGMWGVWGSDPKGDIYSPQKNDKPLEIQAQGLGLFSCRKDRWAEVGGFNPEFDGFGGEEWYIHIKFRQHGGKVMLIPKLRWLHRFNSGQTYPRTNIQKVRNYVIGHRELGLPLDRIYNHFVKGINEDGSSWSNDGSHPQGTDIANANLISEEQWKFLTQIPTPKTSEVFASGQQSSDEGCAGCAVNKANTLDELFEIAFRTPGDINEHAPTLRDLAKQCEVVVDFGMRHGSSTAAMLSGSPKRLISYFPTKFKEINKFGKLAGENHTFEYVKGTTLEVEIPETDLLFIDTVHTGERFLAELEKYHSKVRRWIVRHDTEIYGVKGEDGQLGLLYAIQKFVQAHREWTLVKMYRNNYGLIILSKDDRDKTALPNIATKAWNYARALAKHAANGAKKVNEKTHQARLDICSLCPLLTNGACSVCGCPVDERALWLETFCPHPTEGNKWAGTEKNEQP